MAKHAAASSGLIALLLATGVRMRVNKFRLFYNTRIEGSKPVPKNRHAICINIDS